MTPEISRAYTTLDSLEKRNIWSQIGTIYGDCTGTIIGCPAFIQENRNKMTMMLPYYVINAGLVAAFDLM